MPGMTTARSRLASEQTRLFGDDPALPAGFRYRPEFITPDEERDLVAQIRDLPLAPFQFGIYEGKRRVVYFGTRYDFTHQRLEPAEALPGWLATFARRVEREHGLPPGSIVHALCTEYAAGAGIGWHRDKRHFDQVFGLSLASSCKFRFRRRSGRGWERVTLDAEPRSLYAMTGESRHAWEHSIPAVESTRYSITFRTMA
jgi:alkylated DNA repair dioxygenase AlkB